MTAVEFGEVQRQLKRAQDQRIKPVELQRLETLEKIKSIETDQVSPLIDSSFLIGTIRDLTDKINELIPYIELLKEHNYLLEQKVDEIGRVVTKHTNEIAHNLDRIINNEEQS